MDTLQLSPRRVLQVLLVVVALLVAANLFVLLFLRDYLGYSWAFGLIPLFKLDHEANVPTYFAVSMLLVCAGLLAVIAGLQRRRGAGAFAWTGLAVVFLALSVDEAAAIHELLIGPMQSRFGVSGLLFFGWVIPALVVVVGLGLLYLRFLLALPPKTRNRFIIAGALYVGGALGMEMVGGWWVDNYTSDNLTYVLISTTEETLELLGVVYFCYALLEYMRLQFGTLALQLVPVPEQALHSNPREPRSGAAARPGSAQPLPR